MAKLKIGRIVMGVCQTNCYFIYQEDSKKVIFVDPADKGEYLYQALQKNGLEVAGILLTHGHFDHIWGCEKLRELSGAKVYAYEGEKEVCEKIEKNLSGQAGRPCTVKADVYLKDMQEFEIAGIKGKIMATPGHTEGGCCYYFEEDKILISGDTLFAESVGRTDFPGGSMSTLIRSIQDKLLPLDDDVAVYPGHGEQTTIGHERKYNSFLCE